jgi:hypothetical protein
LDSNHFEILVHKFRTIILAAALAGLALLPCTACGGGGTTGPVITGPTVPGSFTVNRVHALSTQSHLNAKNLDFFSEDFPRDHGGVNPLNVDAVAFFRYPDGTQGLVASINQYWRNGVMMPRDSVAPGRIVFYRKVTANAPGAGMTASG